MTHPSDTRLDEWTAGTLHGPAAASLEAHVDACPACAERLSAAARRELDLFTVAESARPNRSRRPWALAGLALAASAALAVGAWTLAGSSEDVEVVDVSVSCVADADPARCEQRAAARGLMASPSAIPRYEARSACMACGGGG